jgi:CBS domain-containing protein
MPSASLLRELVSQLVIHAPFSGMAFSDVEFVASVAKLTYFAPGECLIEAGQLDVPGCFVIREGTVKAAPPSDGEAEEGLSASLLGMADIFPVGSLLSRRAPRLRYVAQGDVFCWLISPDHFEQLIQRSPVFLDFCRRRLAALAEMSRQAVQAAYATQAAQWRLMSQPLGGMVGRSPVTCTPDTSLRDAFKRMEAEKVGSILITAESSGLPVGILTLQDLIGRIVLPERSLNERVATVMSHPVSTLQASCSVADAVMLMAERKIRHVPVVQGERLIGIVTERDLFALQRRSHRQISNAIDGAAEPERLVAAAIDIRHWARALVAQGMSARHVTRLISQLNDALTRRLVELLAENRRVELTSFCWLAFGSEGREEQTIATDQDNGIVFDDSLDPAQSSRLLALGADVNQWLDRCGYPLCRGNIMAGNPDCCLPVGVWRQRFERWIAHSSPQDLLNASIFFDLRPLAGKLALGEALREHLMEHVPGSLRFLKMMSDNALRNVPPLSLSPGVLGAILPDADSIDLKLSGTMPLVDGARLMALAAGIKETGTAARFESMVARGLIDPGDGQSWVDAFEYLQALRLRVQLDRVDQANLASANRLQLDELSELDRRIVKESFRQVRKLQQRLALDYP